MNETLLYVFPISLFLTLSCTCLFLFRNKFVSGNGKTMRSLWLLVPVLTPVPAPLPNRIAPLTKTRMLSGISENAIVERRIRSSARLSPKPIVRAVALILGLLMLLASVGCASVFRAFPNLHEIKLIGLTAKGS